MKRRTAIFLSGAMAVCIGGYVGWCFRPFYLPPPLKIVGEVSPGGRKVAERWVRYSAYAFRLEFRWDTAWRNLSHPWDCEKATPVEVEELPDKGLWVMRDDLLWGFSKTGGEWDVSTAHYHGYSSGYWSSNPAYRQGAIASRIDELSAEGTKLEVLSLGCYTKMGALLRDARHAADGSRNSAIAFYDREVLGRVTVENPEVRQRLLEELARSIREAAVYDRALSEPPSSHDDITVIPGGDLRLLRRPATGIVPRWGVILTAGSYRAEYLISFDGGEGEAYDDGIAGIGSLASEGGFSVCPPSPAAVITEQEADLILKERLRHLLDDANTGYFRVSARAKEAFEEVLDGQGAERNGSEGKR